MFASKKKLVAGLVMMGTLVGLSPAALAAGVEFQPASKIWFEGDSTLHPYKAESKTWKIKATVTPGKDVKIENLTDLEVVIPAKSLKSGDGALDSNMYKAMMADQHPNIKFVMTNAKVTNTAGGAIEVTADGTLTIAGKEQTTKIVAKGEVKGDTVKVKGTKEIKMSDFGVKPPVLMFGAIKVTDKLTVKYDLVGKIVD